MILSLETSAETGSVALGIENKISEEIAFRSEAGQRHSSLLFSKLEKLKLPSLSLTEIRVGLGPGSFSGIRVALAAAQAIALVKQVPVIGICSAFSVARQKSEVSRLGVFADARRGDFYLTLFEKGELLKPTFLIKSDLAEEEASKLTLAVSAEPLLGIPERAVPRAGDFLFIPRESTHWAKTNLEPIYLREFSPIK